MPRAAAVSTCAAALPVVPAAVLTPVVFVETVRERPRIVLYHQPWIFAHTARLDGSTPYPDGILRLAGVTLK